LAMASPIPRAAPVTSANFPSRSTFNEFSWGR
jgi:hypothetical protein